LKIIFQFKKFNLNELDFKDMLEYLLKKQRLARVRVELW